MSPIVTGCPRALATCAATAFLTPSFAKTDRTQTAPATSSTTRTAATAMKIFLTIGRSVCGPGKCRACYGLSSRPAGRCSSLGRELLLPRNHHLCRFYDGHGVVSAAKLQLLNGV